MTKDQGFLAYLNMDNPEDLDLDDTEVLDRIISKAAKKLVMRNQLSFKPKKQTPYTGWLVTFYEDDAIRLLEHFKNGKRDGPARVWNKNGSKSFECNYKEGKLDGLWTKWYEDGTEAGRRTFKNGERVYD